MGNDIIKTGLEQTVIELLEAHSQSGVNQTNMLLLLSLVNIMGIVDILKYSNAGEGANIELQRGEMTGTPNGMTGTPNGMNTNADLMNLIQQAAAGQLDPVQLLGMLNQPGGQMPNPATLMGLLSQMMPPPPQERKQPQPQSPPPQYNQPTRENTQPPETANQEYNHDFRQEKKEQNIEQEKSASNSKGYLKWDPRLG